MGRRTFTVVVLVLSVAGSVRAGDLSLLDVPEDHWARQSLEFLVKLGLIEGYPDGTFRGNEPLGRYDGAVIFDRLGDYLERKFELPVEESRLPLQVSLLSLEEERAFIPQRRLSLLRGVQLAGSPAPMGP